jgi:hypothetical protein
MGGRRRNHSQRPKVDQRPISNANARAQGTAKEAGDEPPIHAPCTEQKHWNAEEREHHKKERCYWFWTLVLTFVAVVGTITTVVLSKWSLEQSEQAVVEARDATSEAHRQANAAETQLSLAFPPKLRVINLLAYPKGEIDKPINLSADQPISGEAQLIEIGRDGATIKDAVCMVYWREGSLPMLRPYLVSNPESRCDPLVIVVPDTKKIVSDGDIMMPGNIATWRFKTVVPKNYSEKMFLYILGFVSFSDKLTGNRYSLFARRYDPGEQRFVPVNNPDYEREDEQTLDKELP